MFVSTCGVYKHLVRLATYRSISGAMLPEYDTFLYSQSYTEWKNMETTHYMKMKKGVSFFSLSVLKVCSLRPTHSGRKGCVRGSLPSLLPPSLSQLSTSSSCPANLGAQFFSALANNSHLLWCYFSACSAASTGRVVWETMFIISQGCKIFLNGIVSKFWFGNQGKAAFY